METCEHGWSLLCGDEGFGHALHYDPSRDPRACGEAEAAVQTLETLVALEDTNLPRIEYQTAHERSLRQAREIIARYRTGRGEAAGIGAGGLVERAAGPQGRGEA
jgi:hypothetical protein